MTLRFAPASGAAVAALKFAPSAAPALIAFAPSGNISLNVSISFASCSLSTLTRGPAGPSGSASPLAIKKPCIVTTTAAITLSGSQTIDGLLVSTSDRVLVKDQADSIENGVYDVAVAAWSRSSDADESSEWMEGTLVYVTRGTAFARTLWSLTTTGTITLSSSSMTFTLVASSPTTT